MLFGFVADIKFIFRPEDGLSKSFATQQFELKMPKNAKTNHYESLCTICLYSNGS